MPLKAQSNSSCYNYNKTVAAYKSWWYTEISWFGENFKSYSFLMILLLYPLTEGFQVINKHVD